MQFPVKEPQGEPTSIYMDDGSSMAGAGIRTESLSARSRVKISCVGNQHACSADTWRCWSNEARVRVDKRV